MSEKLISVIVASYNHSSYVIECLDSLLSQTYKNWELIIADDASKDDSVATINKWLDKHGVVAKKNFHGANTGFCTTLNECVKLCEGDYIKIIAADDVIMPELLTKTVGALESLDNDYGLVYSNAAIINKNSFRTGKLVLTPELTTPSGWVKDILLQGNFLPALTVLMKKKVLDVIGEFDTNLIAEDFDYWLRASGKFKFHYIAEPLALYRVHGENISLNYDNEGEVRKIIIKHDEHLTQKEKLNIFFKERYYKNEMSESLRDLYFSYAGRNKWMTWCLKKNIPYSFFRLVDK